MKYKYQIIHIQKNTHKLLELQSIKIKRYQ